MKQPYAMAEDDELIDAEVYETSGFSGVYVSGYVGRKLRTFWLSPEAVQHAAEIVGLVKPEPKWPWELDR